MLSILAHARPLDLLTNQRVDVRIGSSRSAAALGLDGKTWEPAFAPGGRPRGSIELLKPDMAPGIRLATTTMKIAMGSVKSTNVRRLHWPGAPVTIYRADSLRWPAPVEFDGVVKSVDRSIVADTIELTLEVSTRRLETDLLTEFYNGDGAGGGDPDGYGTLRPLAIGRNYNIEVLFFDTIRNIGQIDGYGNCETIFWLGEGLSSFGPPRADYPDYASLAAAIDSKAIKEGQWATCNARGMIGLGAPPAGVITAHAQCRYGMTGQFLRYLIAERAAVPPALVIDRTFGDLDNAVPYPIHFWTKEQVQIKDLVEQLADACNAIPLISFQGMFGISRPFGGENLGTLRRGQYNEPDVTAWETATTLDPIFQLKMRTARPARVMTLDEINYEDTFTPRGSYVATTTYRSGDLVWTVDGSQWLYKNAAAEAGHAPPIGDPDGEDDWWRKLKEPTKEQVAQTYRDAAEIDPNVAYTKGDLVRNQGAVWIYTLGTPWNKQTYPPTLPQESNSTWSLVVNATVYSVEVTPANFTIRTDTANKPVAGQIPTGGTAVFKAGQAKVTNAVQWTATASGATVQIAADGTFQVTAVTAPGYIDVTGTYLGTSITKRIPVALSGDASPAGGGGGTGTPSSATITALPVVSSATYPTAPSSYVTVNAGAGPVNLSVDLTYQISSSTTPRSVNIAAKLIYRPAGSSSGWTDVAAETAGSVATASGRPDFNTEPGYLAFNRAVTGLTAGSGYDFAILLRQFGTAAANTTQPYGSVGVTAS